MAGTERVEATITVNDYASTVLRRIADNALRLEERFGGASAAVARFTNITPRLGLMTKVVSALSAAAGGISFAMGIRSASEYYKHVERISETTGMTATHAGALYRYMTQMGVEGAGVENILVRMDRKTESVAEGSKKLGAMYSAMGLNLSDGPEKSMLHLAELSQQGKLTIGELIRVTGVARNDAFALQRALQQAPEAMAASLARLQFKASIVNDAAIKAYERVREKVVVVKQGLTDLVIAFTRPLMPALEKLLDSISNKLDEWIPKAYEFGTIVSKHMDKILDTAQTILEALIGIKAISLTLTGAQGAIKAMSWLSDLAKPAAGAAGGLAESGAALGLGKAAIALDGAAIALTEAAAALTGSGAIQAGEGALGAVGAAGAGAGILKFGKSAMARMVGGAGAGAVAAEGAGAIGAGTALGLEGGAAAAAAAGPLAIAAGAGEVAVTGLVSSIAAAALPIAAMAAVLGIVGVAAYKVYDLVTTMRADKPDTSGLHDADKEGLDHTKKKTPIAGLGGNYQDFRFSKFDIRQQFAQGFDPGRVSLMFTQDLASLGETLPQSRSGLPMNVAGAVR